MELGTHSEPRAATTPTVTVILQTFNRSNIQEYAIGSVLQQPSRTGNCW
ncbi:MAG TPA: hypothetical protein VG429_04090 [Casimicrobiaceae bacterium]|jgi:hypothetical protein|nr:hypothetical protein [Casimicrobiaceae bacterium]